MFDAITTVQDGVSLLSTGQDWTADRAEGLITGTVTSERQKGIQTKTTQLQLENMNCIFDLAYSEVTFLFFILFQAGIYNAKNTFYKSEQA